MAELHPQLFTLLLPEISLAGCLSVCRDRVSLCNPDLSGTRDIDQTHLRLRVLPASASRCRWITGVGQHISMTGWRSFDATEGRVKYSRKRGEGLRFGVHLFAAERVA